MGTLLKLDSGDRVVLKRSTRFGRGRANDIRLGSLSVSNSHAEFRWQGDGWWVRDLASTNGTFVNDVQIATDCAIDRGDVIRFGHHASERWRLIDDRAPDAMARSEAGSELRGNPLALPEDEPRYVVMASGSDPEWVLHDTAAPEASSERVVRDGDRIEVDGERWTLYLPARVTRTLDLAARPTVATLHLTFEMDDDAPRALEVQRPDGSRVGLPSLAFLRLLFWLAKRRLDDQSERLEVLGAGPMPATDARGALEVGWTPADTLRELLGCSRQGFNVDAYRARRAFATEIGVEDFASIIEKRSVAGRGYEYRIGTGHLAIVEISES